MAYPILAAIKILPPGQGDALWTLMRNPPFSLTRTLPGGAFEFSELVAQLGNGPPLHLHRHENERFYALEGDFAFAPGGRTFWHSAATC